MTVLSLAKVTTGAAAASYCEDASDYYVDDHSPSQWWGKGATSLRLDGAVDPACFRAPLDGEMPDGSVLHNAAEGRRGGTDLTFSAPKSVSLQALVGDDATLIDAHENAVRKALSYAETLASYRMTEDGVTRPEPSKNLVVAMFRHDLSRATDPPLHTHAVVINATERSDGQWRALDQSEFYRQQKLIGALYRAELALEVQQLGYSIRLTHADGRFELAHFTPEQIEAFSGRSRAIEAALEQIGKTRAEATAHEKEMATLATRDKKTEVDRMALRARWREQSRELGIEYAPTKRVMKVSSAQRRNAARESLRYAVAHTTERQAIVTEPQLLRAAFEQGTGQTDLITVRQELARAVRKGELLHFNQCYTTPEAQQLEREILAVERRGRSAVTPIANRWQAQERVGKNVLNEEQRKAALLIVTADARVSAIQGSAGTGKTTMLASAREVAESNGYHMIGLAPSAAAARELHKAGIESQTLAAFSHRTDQMLNERSILVLDEAGMMATRDMHAVLRRAETWGARVVLVGDVQQLKAIEAGKPFAQLQAAGIARVEMKSIQRQTNAELRTAVELAAKGEVTRSLFTLAPHVVEIDYATARYQAMAKDFASLDETSRASTLIVAGTRAAREAINTQVRQQLGLAGRGVTFSALKRKDMTRAQARSSVSYQVGEIVQANKRYAASSQVCWKRPMGGSCSNARTASTLNGDRHCKLIW